MPEGAAASAAIPVMAIRIALMINRLPLALRDVLARLAAPGVSSARSAVLLIGEALVVRRWPELRLAPAMLATTVEQWAAQLAAPALHAATLAAPLPAPAAQVARRSSRFIPPTTLSTPAFTKPFADDRIPTAPSFALGRAPAIAGQDEFPAGMIRSYERYSPASGLLLTVIPLIELGWREWLAERPELFGTAPGLQLLDSIAAHHRVPPDDPVRQLWDLDPGESAEWQRLWRVGLDRWLKRHTGLKLHRLIWRRGWITGEPDALRVRFPLDSVEIRLRRYALDRDPGWVDWLGRSVRYVYRDTAEHVLAT